MASVHASQGSRLSVEARILRANGEVVELGEIASSDDGSVRRVPLDPPEAPMPDTGRAPERFVVGVRNTDPSHALSAEFHYGEPRFDASELDGSLKRAREEYPRRNGFEVRLLALHFQDFDAATGQATGAEWRPHEEA